MGDDLSLDERNSIRTPMQWSNTTNAGFSTAPPGELVRPVIDRGPFRYQEVNVAAQQRDRSSLLSVTERMIRVRKESPEFGRGRCRLVETGDPAVLAHRCDGAEGSVLAVHNLSGKERRVTLDLEPAEARGLLELLDDDPRGDEKRTGASLDLAPYGYRWFRIAS